MVIHQLVFCINTRAENQPKTKTISDKQPVVSSIQSVVSVSRIKKTTLKTEIKKIYQFEIV